MIVVDESGQAPFSMPSMERSWRNTNEMERLTSDPIVEDPTSFTATNPEQTRTVMDCLTLLRPWFTGTIRVVCFYAGQAKELGVAVLKRLETKT
ncbi:hypothetical protein GPALN_004834 [Globodera pallida]|nr:hypothetical protein GPALN_004834 [Globodera pallida]